MIRCYLPDSVFIAVHEGLSADERAFDIYAEVIHVVRKHMHDMGLSVTLRVDNVSLITFIKVNLPAIVQFYLSNKSHNDYPLKIIYF